MNRRGFLLGMLAAGAAPAIVKAANLMPLFVRRESGLLAPEQFVITEVWTGGDIVTAATITRQALQILNVNPDWMSRVGGDLGDFRVGDVIYFARPRR